MQKTKTKQISKLKLEKLTRKMLIKNRWYWFIRNIYSNSLKLRFKKIIVFEHDNKDCTLYTKNTKTQREIIFSSGGLKLKDEV